MPWVEAYVGGMDTVMIDLEEGRMQGPWRGQVWQFDFAKGGDAWYPHTARIPLGASTVMKNMKKKNTMKSMTKKSTQKNNMKKKSEMKKSEMKKNMNIMKKRTQ